MPRVQRGKVTAISTRWSRRVAAPCVCFVLWAALASFRTLPQQLLPVSATGGGRRRCKQWLLALDNPKAEVETKKCQPLRSDGLRCPASTSCLERHSCPADRCPNSSSLYPPLAAVVAVALFSRFSDLKAPQSLRDSSPQGSGCSRYLCLRHDPSRENAFGAPRRARQTRI